MTAVEFGLFPSLIAACDHFSEATVLECLRIFQLMTIKSLPMKSVAREAGVIQCISSILSRYSDNASIASSAILALTALLMNCGLCPLFLLI